MQLVLNYYGIKNILIRAGLFLKTDFWKERDFSDIPTIPEYYKDKTIFLTGGSGFMGKVLVEKLLYSCSDLNRIYLLLRDKKGVKSEDRLNAIYTSMCFDRLRNEKPDIFKQKVFFIAGDVSELGLGISDEDRTLIVNRTNIIFHSAASVRFDDSLKESVKLNLRGTREVIELAKEVRNLEVYVHVSTSYANTTRDCIDEVIYPDWRDTLEVSEKMDDHTLKVLTPKYLGELPNTYVFTKQLAEHVVAEQRGKLPIVIMRPSIVIASYREPLEGWMENFNGPMGLLIAISLGILRTLRTSPDIELDFIPVDIAIKSFITAAWERGTARSPQKDQILVYNCSSSHMKTLNLGEIGEFGRTILQNELPLENSLWPMGISLTTSKLEYDLKVLLFHFLPAMLIDLGLKISGNKTMLTKIQRRIYRANVALQYYLTQQWIFTNNNILALRSKIKEEDVKHFFYEMETIDVTEYYKNGCIGAKIFILNEKMENLPKAKKRYMRMKLLDRTLRIAFKAYSIWFIINTKFVSNMSVRMLQSIYNLDFGI